MRGITLRPDEDDDYINIRPTQGTEADGRDDPIIRQKTAEIAAKKTEQPLKNSRNCETRNSGCFLLSCIYQHAAPGVAVRGCAFVTLSRDLICIYFYRLFCIIKLYSINANSEQAWKNN